MVGYHALVTLLDDDALVLDHHPFRDRHLILAVLTRRCGVQRGVLRRARGGKAPPAAAVQTLSHVQVSLYQRPSAELATFRHVDLVTSSFPLSSNLSRSAAGSVVAELLLTFCPPAEPAERSFRLGVAALESLLAGGEPALVVAYVEFWMLALGGVLPSAENLGASLSDKEIGFLESCRQLPINEVAREVPPNIVGWLDRRVREEADRNLRALEFFRQHAS